MKFEDLAVGIEFHASELYICQDEDGTIGDSGFVKQNHEIWECQKTEKGTWMCMTKYVSEFWK